MSPRQPFAEVACGLVGGRAVERHEGGRDAGNPDNTGPPPVLGYSCDLDQVRTSPDQFLKAMDSCVHVETIRRNTYQGVGWIVRGWPNRSSEARDEGMRSIGASKDFKETWSKINFAERSVHRKCTFRQQLFHIGHSFKA